MKLVILSLVLISASFAQAATIKLDADESAKVVGNLLLAGVKANKSKPIYKLTVADLNCAAYNVSHAGSPDDVLWGFDVYRCAKPLVKDAAAKLVYDTLDDLQTKYAEKISITDCAMGKCYTALKLVNCTINSDEPSLDKRFACELTDTQ